MALPKIKRPGPDPFSAGASAYRKGEPFDSDFGHRFPEWGIISAQCLYETGRLLAAENKTAGAKRARRRKL